MVRVAWPGWWLGLLLLGVEAPLAAQGASEQPPSIELKENYPNPFFPSTTIPFVIEPEVCRGGHRPEVSLRIYNVIVEVVAVPTLSGRPETRIERLSLACGSYEAFWDGRYADGERQVVPGVYYSELTVDGRRFTRKMIAQRRSTATAQEGEEGRP